MAPLLDELVALERELHHAGMPCPSERLERLLHRDFHEVGRSGRVYDRATVIAWLAAQDDPPPTVSDRFTLDAIGEGIALLGYRSAQRRADGGLDLHTLRASLWLRGASGWQVRYHQGTPAAEPWTA